MSRKPALSASFAAADKLAIERQHAHNFWLRNELLALVLAGLATALPPSWLPSGTPANLLASVFLGVMLFALIARAWRWAKRHQQIWFQARAIAESIKREAWLFMMQAGGYGETNARHRFSDALAEYHQSNVDLFGQLPLDQGTGGEISRDMAKVHGSNLGARQAVYDTHRFKDQIAYYTRRAEEHKSQAHNWGIGALAFEFLALLLAVVALFQATGIGYIGFLTTAAAAAVAWVQARDGERLARSYRMVAHDLNRLAAKYGGELDEGEFRRFVEDVERTLSREHTYWRSRVSS